MWHIGQRVVCVVDIERHDDGIINPKKGKIYTIREIDASCGRVGFRFSEIVNIKKHYANGYSEPRYWEVRFRPIDEKRIDIFRAMLKNKEKEKVS